MGKDDKIIEKLLSEDVDFQNLFSEHRQLDEQVAELEEKESLTPAEEREVKQLKKLKLALKDKMQQRIKAAK